MKADVTRCETNLDFVTTLFECDIDDDKAKTFFSLIDKFLAEDALVLPLSKTAIRRLAHGSYSAECYTEPDFLMNVQHEITFEERKCFTFRKLPPEEIIQYCSLKRNPKGLWEVTADESFMQHVRDSKYEIVSDIIPTFYTGKVTILYAYAHLFFSKETTIDELLVRYKRRGRQKKKHWHEACLRAVRTWMDKEDMEVFMDGIMPLFVDEDDPTTYPKNKIWWRYKEY